MEYKESEVFRIKDNPEIDEKRIQGIIKANPSILGLEDNLISRDSERRQPSGGKLDLLLENSDSMTRYEIELQTGRTDESHIIRTLEYWDIERNRYPQYTHIAVIIAEDITNRFFNVISLFNGHIPIIAIQMTALRLNDNEYSLSFAKVLNLKQLGPTEEVVDRQYWLRRGTKVTVDLADKLLSYIHEFDESYKLNYTKAYIGLENDEGANNFVSFTPRKKEKAIVLRLRLEKNVAIDTFLEGTFSKWDYREGWEKYKLNLSENEVTEKKDALLELLRKAYEA